VEVCFATARVRVGAGKGAFMKKGGFRLPTGIGSKIVLVAVGPVVIGLAATLVTLVVQQKELDRHIEATIRQQAFDEAAKVAESVYLLCEGFERRNLRELESDVAAVRGLLERAGGVEEAGEKVTWQVVDPATGETSAVVLPKWRWTGDGGGAGLVDEARRVTGRFCTVYQRINDAGDMVRVATNLPAAGGRSAEGVLVRASNGAEANPAVRAVLGGEGFRGRVKEGGAWLFAGYAPIRDAQRRVIGMISVAEPFDVAVRDVRDAVAKMTLGRTGYVYILGGRGEERGHYLLSYQGKRDGEDIWQARDASGRLFIQAIVEKAIRTEGGKVEFETYPWQNAGEPEPRMKFVATTQFAPWNWVIGASGYEDEFAGVKAGVDEAQRRMMAGVAVAAGVVATLAALAGLWFARKIAGPIARVIANVSESSAQIQAAASQTSGASQSLAAGSSEQAASLEEVSASLEEMAGVTRRNAENAVKASELTRAARAAADGGVGDMQAMSGAMHEIKASSDDIAKIIKTIDAIAFQTNILALNAAVEAARAGESGMGFAVVAEEVRSLAQRSAQAARETAGKIEGAIGKTEQGVRISDKVERSLAEIVEKVREVDALVAEVAGASREQSQGVEQINHGVREMDRVVQSNAAAAEQSASASAELKNQAVSLNETVAMLRRLVGGQREDGEGETLVRTDGIASGGRLADAQVGRQAGESLVGARRYEEAPRSRS